MWFTRAHIILRCRSKLNVFNKESSLNFHETALVLSRRENSKVFQPADEEFIINTLNQCQTPEDFEKYDIKSRQLKKLLEYRERYGNFKNFNEFLISQDIPGLIKLSQTILAGGKKTQLKKQRISNNVITPPINKKLKEHINTIVGLSIWNDMISWAKLDENNTLVNWELQILNDNNNSTKPTLLSLVNQLVGIASNIPDADAYVMESDVFIRSPHKQKASTFALYLQRQQTLSTIMGILLLRKNNLNSNDHTNINPTNFFMLQPLAMARKFNLYMGNEIVAADDVIADILNGNIKKYQPKFENFAVESEILNEYSSKSLMPFRSQLHTALLVALTFADIVKYDANTNDNDDNNNDNMRKLRG